MDQNNIFKLVQWQGPQPIVVFYVSLFIFLLLAVFGTVKYLQYRKERRLHDTRLFMFRLKAMGLTNFQMKILNNLIDTLKLISPLALLEQPALYETGVLNFFTFLRARNEEAESMAAMARDFAHIYNRLYHHRQVMRPLASLVDLEETLLLNVRCGDQIYVARIIDRTRSSFTLRLLCAAAEARGLAGAKEVTVQLWRMGDAEYEFTAPVTGLTLDQLVIGIPGEFKRGDSDHHPLLDIVLPVVITQSDLPPDEPQEKQAGTAFKINEFELYVRLASKLDFQRRYTAEFVLEDFNFRAICRVLTTRAVEEGNLYYYTLKYEEISPVARQVLKKYLYDHS